jgi:predicted phosphodiesterase
MKLLIYSDIHQEFDGFTPKKEWLDAADVVIQVGDLHHAPNNIKILKTWDAKILFVPGNHDFWNTNVKQARINPYAWNGGGQGYFVECDRTWEQCIEEMREAAEGSKIELMDNNTKIINGVRFIGSTLWYNALSLSGWEVANINDYKRIFFGGNQLITPAWVQERHNISVEFIREELSKPFDGKTVLMTHHPTWIPPGSKEAQCSIAYGNDLEKLWTGKVDLIIHGHFHAQIDRVISGTRIICNPRGYPSEDVRRTFKKNLLVEI